MLAGRTYAAAGDAGKAEEMLKKAIETEPSRLQAYNMLGGLYIKQHQIEDAKAQFQKIAEQDPKSTFARTMIGILLEVQKRLPEAEQQYQKVLSVDAKAPVAANNLAWLYVAGNRNLDEALHFALIAKEQLPDEPHVSDTLGWIYYRKDQPAAAVRHLEASVQKDPSDPTTHYHLGMAYIQVGENGKAKQELQRALAFKVEFDGAADARKMLVQMGS
jgi:Flp pilus assembly protein TadD